jgi:hypothetical protein
MIVILFLVVSCLVAHGSASCTNSPGAKRLFNVASYNFHINVSPHSASMHYYIVFYPSNGAAFDINEGLINILGQSNKFFFCNNGLDNFNYQLEEVCEDNGGRISCKIDQVFDHKFRHKYLPNSTCLPAGTTLDFDIKIETHQPQWGSDRVQLCRSETVEVQDSFTSNTGNSTKHYNTTTVF